MFVDSPRFIKVLDAPSTTSNKIPLSDMSNLLRFSGSDQGTRRVRVQGSNALRINATGTVQILGVLDVSGFNARDVEEVNTGDIREEGGLPGPGGGRGGRANEVVNTSTPRGGPGQGPLDEINAGGQVGETGYVRKEEGKEARRPGGGAGGRFAPVLAENGCEVVCPGSRPCSSVQRIEPRWRHVLWNARSRPSRSRTMTRLWVPIRMTL